MFNDGTAPVTITGFTSDNPNVTIVSDINAGNPVTLQPGEKVAVTELCYQRADAGKDTAIVLVIANDDDGDVECVVTGEAEVTTSVQEEEIFRLQVRFDASTNTIRYEDDRRATLFDVYGHAVGVGIAGNRSLDVAGRATGLYFLVLETDPQMMVPVSIVR